MPILLLAQINIKDKPEILYQWREETQLFPKIFNIRGDVYVLIAGFDPDVDKDKRGMFTLFKNGKFMWSVEMHNPLYYGFSIVDDSLIIIGDRGCSLYVYTLEGEQVLRKKLEGPGVYDVSVEEEVLVFKKYKFVFLDKNTFAVKRVLRFKPTNFNDVLSYCYDSGYIYVQHGSSGNSIVCCSTKDTLPLWKISLGSKKGAIFSILPAPEVITKMKKIDWNIYAGTLIGDVFEMDNNGNILKKYGVLSGLSVGDIGKLTDERLLVEMYEGILVCIERKTGKKLWEFKMEGKSCYLPLVLEDAGMIVAIDAKGNVFMLNFSGEIVKEWKLQGEFYESIYFLAGDIDLDSKIELILKGSSNGKLYLFETDIGCERGEIIRGDR